MPAPQLPWFRFWKGATQHDKVRELSDAEFRTWVELLDLAAQQKWRGRFRSRKAAAALSRRPDRHIGSLIKTGLIDIDSSDEHLTMHDWDEWQRWRKEDVNDDGTPPDHPPNGHAIDSRTTHEQPLNDPALRVRAAAPASGEERGEKRDIEIDTPAATQQPPRARRETVVDDEFKERLEEQFWEAFGSREAVQDSIAAALGYKKRSNYTDQRAFLRNWVRSDAERSQTRRSRVVPITGRPQQMSRAAAEAEFGWMGKTS